MATASALFPGAAVEQIDHTTTEVTEAVSHCRQRLMRV